MVLTTRVGTSSTSVAYTVIDIPSILSSPLGQPWGAYLLQVMSQRIAMTILALTIICAFSQGQACMISASRVNFAYSRDRCLPGSRIWRTFSRRTQTPVNAVWLNAVLGICLCTAHLRRVHCHWRHVLDWRCRNLRVFRHSHLLQGVHSRKSL